MTDAKAEEMAIAGILKDIIPDGIPRVFIDVGGNQEAEVSDPFSRLGWDVLIIEPQDYCFKALVKKYAEFDNVRVLKLGCSDQKGEFKLFHGSGGQGAETATLSTDSDPWMDQARDKNSYEIVQVERLEDVLVANGFDKGIGILKVDTESWDFFVLRGLNLDRFTPKIIITEEYLWDINRTIDKHVLLEDAGYVNLGFLGYNTIWSHRSCGARWSYKELRPWLSKVGVVHNSIGPLAVLHGVDVLSAKSRVSSALDLGRLDIRIGIDLLPPMKAGQSINVRVVVTNFSKVNVPSLPAQNSRLGTFLSYHWLDSKGDVVVWDGLRTELPRDLNAGDSIVTELGILAPSVPGTYWFVADFLQEEVGWLSLVAETAKRGNSRVMVDVLI